MSFPVQTARFRSVLSFALTLFLLAAIVSWFGTRERFETSASPTKEESVLVVPVGGPIALPIVAIEPPEGLYRDIFISECITCHSSRLPLTQPEFSEKKWSEVVHKMVASYGAPLSTEHEAKIVVYLREVQAKRGNE